MLDVTTQDDSRVDADRTDRNARGLLLFCLAVYAIHAAYATVTHRHLYGDAAWFLVRIISEGRVTNFYSNFFTEFYYSRFVSYALTQLPTVLAARLGVGDWQVLSWVMGATYFLHKPLSLLACFLLLPRGTKLAIIFPALAIFAGTIISEIYIVTETHIAVSLYWPLLIAFSLWQRPSTGFFLIGAISCLVLAFSYESVAFLGPFLWAVVFIRWLHAAREQRAGWAWLLLAALVPIAINWMAILLPRDPTNKAAFTDGLMMLWRHSTTGLPTAHASAVAALLALFAVGVMLLVPGLARLRTLGWPLLASVAVSVAAFPLFHFLRYAGQVDFSHAITDRGFGGLAIQVLLVLMFLLSVVTGFARLRQHVVGVVVVVVALAAGQIVWQLMATRSWDYAIHTASEVLKDRRGYVACSADSLPQSSDAERIAPAAGILCHWWVMPLSVLLAPDGQVRAMFTSKESFKPFDPLVSKSLPSMQFAPVDYSRFLSEGLRGRTVSSGETVFFTKGGRGLDLIGSGFSHPEDWATWTDGPQVELAFCVVGTGRQEVIFTLAPFVNEARPTLDAEILIDGKAAAQWHFVAGETQVERSIVVAGVAAGAATGCTQMIIKFSDSRRASELSVAGDPRRLGLAFVKLAVRNASN